MFVEFRTVALQADDFLETLYQQHHSRPVRRTHPGP